MFKLSRHECSVSQFFDVHGTKLYKKNIRLIKQRGCLKHIHNNITGFSRLHGVCHSHHRVFSSAPVPTVAQVEKHWPI